MLMLCRHVCRIDDRSIECKRTIKMTINPLSSSLLYVQRKSAPAMETGSHHYNCDNAVVVIKPTIILVMMPLLLLLTAQEVANTNTLKNKRNYYCYCCCCYNYGRLLLHADWLSLRIATNQQYYRHGRRCCGCGCLFFFVLWQRAVINIVCKILYVHKSIYYVEMISSFLRK